MPSVYFAHISFMLKYPSTISEGNEVFNPELRIIGLRIMLKIALQTA